jgi:hypothetical protein
MKICLPVLSPLLLQENQLQRSHHRLPDDTVVIVVKLVNIKIKIVAKCIQIPNNSNRTQWQKEIGSLNP